MEEQTVYLDICWGIFRINEYCEYLPGCNRRLGARLDVSYVFDAVQTWGRHFRSRKPHTAGVLIFMQKYAGKYKSLG